MLVKRRRCLPLPLPILPKAWPQSYSPDLFHPNIGNWLKPKSSITSRVSCADAPLRDATPIPNPVAALPPDPNTDPQRLLPMTTDVRKAKPGPAGLPLAAASSRPRSSLPSSRSRRAHSSHRLRGGARKNQRRLTPSASRQQRDGHNPCGRLPPRGEKGQRAGRRSVPRAGRAVRGRCGPGAAASHRARPWGPHS